MDRYGQAGVAALAQATPKETGETAGSWHYRVTKTAKYARIDWYNTHVDNQGTPIVILIQYGHATGSGAWIEGRDFINPTMRPLFDQFVLDIWEKVREK